MRHLAIGDPQAPFERFLEILEFHGLLASPERLADDVHLVSMGDHFDWGPKELRERAADDGERLLAWLAGHSEEQVTLLVGNHDLARVGELGTVDDSTFAEAQRVADEIYADGDVDELREAEFLREFPFAPTAELIARDYSAFRQSQRTLVEELLRAGRFRLAHAHAGLLLVHAGVTRADLGQLHLAPATAAEAAQGLNAFLQERVAGWATGTALSLEPVHASGSAASGEGRGVLYHRPSDPSGPDQATPLHFEGPPRRRFDPRTLPTQFPQAIGHVRDKKCRALMPHWHDGAPARDGALRSMRVDAQVQYAFGVQPDARLIFLDGGMGHGDPRQYQLLDLETRQPAVLPASSVNDTY
jgi:hypothetical protein